MYVQTAFAANVYSWSLSSQYMCIHGQLGIYYRYRTCYWVALSGQVAGQIAEVEDETKNSSRKYKPEDKSTQINTNIADQSPADK